PARLRTQVTRTISQVFMKIPPCPTAVHGGPGHGPIFHAPAKTTTRMYVTDTRFREHLTSPEVGPSAAGECPLRRTVGRAPVLPSARSPPVFRRKHAWPRRHAPCSTSPAKRAAMRAGGGGDHG